MATLDLRDLALLVEVVDAGSITAGARRCALSLSAASVRITALERHFGVRLLDRGRRGVAPTPAGAALAARGRRLLAGAHDLESEMAARARGLENRVRLATNSSAADALTEFLASTLNRLPGTAVTMTELSSAEAVEHVLHDRADLAVVSSVPSAERPSDQWSAPCPTRGLWDDDLVVIGPVSSMTRRPLTLAEVLHDPLVGLLEGSPLQDLVDRHARRLGTEPAYRVRLPSLGAVCAVASTGAGRAVVPHASARRHGIAPASVRALDEPWARRRATLVARDFAALDATTTAFVELLLAHRLDLDADAAGSPAGPGRDPDR